MAAPETTTAAGPIMDPAAVVVDLDPVDIRSIYPVRMSTMDRTRMMERIADNIETVAATMTPVDVAAGVGWYPLARRIIRGIALHHDDTVTVDMVTGLVAASSPRQSWPDNLLHAHRIADDPVAVSRVMSSVRPTVAAIRSGVRPLSVIRGRKSREFYMNLSGDVTAVTADIWIIRIAAGDMTAGDYEAKTLERVGMYDLVADSIRIAAGRSRWNLRPSELQAAVWHRIRTIYGRTDRDPDMMDDTAAGVRATVRDIIGRTVT